MKRGDAKEATGYQRRRNCCPLAYWTYLSIGLVSWGCLECTRGDIIGVRVIVVEISGAFAPS